MKTIKFIVPDEVCMYSATLVSSIDGVGINLAVFGGNVEDKTELKFAWANSSEPELIVVEE